MRAYTIGWTLAVALLSAGAGAAVLAASGWQTLAVTGACAVVLGVMVGVVWAEEAGRLVEMANEWTSKFADRPLVVIGVNHDDRKTLRELEENQVLFRNFSDPGKDLAREYRVGTWPLVYVLGKDRVIGYSGAPGSFAELSAEAMLAGTQP